MASSRNVRRWWALLYMLLVVLSSVMLGVGIADWVNGRETPVLMGAGWVALVVLAIGWPLVNAAWRLGGRTDRTIDDLLSDQVTLSRAISERVSMSSPAQQVAFRHREREALRAAIRADIKAGDLEMAMTLAHTLERMYMAKAEADALREEIQQARQSAAEQEILDAMRPFEDMLARRDWEAAKVEGARLARKFPNTPHTKDLASRVQETWEAYKHELERRFLEANNRDDVETAMELLKELDQYLTETEAAPFMEIARGVISKKRQNLGVQFKLAVHDKEWDEAIMIGEEIVDEFPNSQMAGEVRGLLPQLRSRAAARRAGEAMGNQAI